MSLEFIRHNYHVPAKRGGRVRLGQGFGPNFAGMTGTILSANHRLRVRMDDGRRVILHPTWEVEYLR